MTEYEIYAVRVDLILRQSIARRGWLTKLARRIGWSVGTIGYFRRGNYPWDMAPIAQALKAEFARMDQGKARRRAITTSMVGMRPMKPKAAFI